MRFVTALLLLLLAPAALAQPCDPAQTDEACPDTTTWHRYFPLDVGNQWQYRQHLIEEAEEHWSWAITGESELDGQTYFELERCEAADDGSALCDEPILVRYDDEHAMIVRRDGDAETWWDELPCRLNIDFNADFFECTGPGTEEAFFTGSVGTYGASVSVPPDVLSGDTRKSFEQHVGTGQEMYAGLGMRAYHIELQSEPPELVYAYVGGEQYGTPAFASCDPAQTDLVCPDTTDWKRYLPPLAVGNQWQYDYEGFCSEIEPCRTGREVVGSEVIEGVEHFLVRSCNQYIEGDVTCREPVPVSYETPSIEECILSLPFNYSGVPDCEYYPFYHHISGRYDGVFDLGEGPSIEGTRKEIDSIGGYAVFYAGVGRTYSLGDGSEFGEPLVYARIDGVEYGSSAFAFPTAEEPEASRPAATAFTEAFPNPTHGAVQAQYTLSTPQAVTLELIDLLGRRVRSVEIGRQAAGAHDVRIDTGGLRPGLYVLRLRGDAGAEATRQIVVVQ